jgi:hypothetical protein
MKRIFLSTHLLLISLFAFSQNPSLEFFAGAGNPNGSGPSLSNQVITFQENTNNPTGIGVAAYSPTLSATFSLSNQQLPIPISPNQSLIFGGTVSGNSIVGFPFFPTMNGISAPANSHFTSTYLNSAGSGIAVNSNQAVSILATTLNLQNNIGSKPTNGRYYFGDLTITFSTPVTKPVIHIVGLGGFFTSGSTLGFTSELELQTSGVTLSKLSGSSELNVTVTNKILNSDPTPSSATGSGAASGSILASSSLPISTLTFKVYLRGDGGNANWGVPSVVTGDVFLMGVSLPKPVIVSGTIFNDNTGNTAIDGTGLGNPGGTPLYAILVNSSGNVVQSVAVNTNGTYQFPSVLPADYSVRISTTAGVVGNAAPASSLPSGWINVGENIGLLGNDGNANGSTNTFTVNGNNVPNVNFGIMMCNSTPPNVTPTIVYNGCNVATANLNSVAIASSPSSGYRLVWSKNNPPLNANDTLTTAQAGAISLNGKYYAFYTNGNCFSQSDSVTVSLHSNLSASMASPSMVTCFGGSNGSAAISASGGATPYLYSWAPSGGSATNASGLVANTYTCTVTDVRGCTSTSTVAISQPAQITSSINTQTNVSCNGGNNGSVTLTIGGGTAPYTYTWSPTGGTSSSASGLVAGSYTCTIKDANNCTKTQVVTITQPSALTLTLTNSSIACAADSSTITANAAGGTSPYQYKLNAGGFESSNLIKALAGAYTITVKDANNCTKTSAISFNYLDNVAPSLSCPSNVTTTVSAGTCAKTVSGINATYSDNCGISKLTWSKSGATIDNSASSGINQASGTSFNKGVTTVSYTVTDINGNTTSCNFTVTVNDNEVPSVTCPSNKVVSADASCLKSVTGIAPTASDNCGATTISYSITGATATSGDNDASGTIFSKGTSTITYTALDGSGNSNTCNFTVTVNDSTKPNLLCMPTQTLSLNVLCTVEVPDFTGLVGVSDNCTANANLVITQSPTAGTVLTGAGTQAIKMYATDQAGNVDSCTFDVIKDNVNPPIINCISDQNVYLGSGCNGTLPDYRSMLIYGDVCNGTNGVALTQSPVGGTSISGLGDLTVTFTAYDSNTTLTSNCSIVVHKLDNTAPSITCPSNSDVYLNASCTYTVPDFTGSVSLSDGCYTTPQITVTQFPTAGTVSSGTGTITVQLTATDNSGNASTCEFTITKLDTIKPTITCPSDITTTTDAGLCTASLSSLGIPVTNDNCGIDFIATNLVSNNFSLGNTNVTWTVTDLSGNSKSCTQVVTVSDQTAPIISVCSPSQTVHASASCQGVVPDFTSALSASDNCTATPSLTITQSPLQGSNLSLGTHTVTITVTDASNNSSTCTSSLTIVDTTTQYADAGSAQSLNCASNSATIGTAALVGYSYSWSPATGLSATNIAQPTASPSSNTIYTVTVTTNNGCVTTDTVSVFIDNTQPLADAGSAATITCAANSPVNIGSAAINGNTYSWSPSSGLNSSSIAEPSALPSATTDYTVTVTGSNGCTATSNVTITVDDNLPVADAGADDSLDCNTPSVVIGSVAILGNTYAWSPADGLSATNVAQPTATPTSTSIYTVTVTGSNGCTATSSVTLNLDNTPPTADAGLPLYLDCIIASGTIGTAPIDGYSYSWSPATGLSSTSIAEPTASPLVTTIYTVTVTGANGCTATSTVLVDKTGVSIPAPDLLAYPGNQFCLGTDIKLKAKGSTTSTFNWITPVGCPLTIDNSNAGLSTISISNLPASCNGYFKVNQTNGCGISNYDSILVNAGNLPSINSVTSTCVGPNGQLTINATGTTSLEYAVNGGSFQSGNIQTATAGTTFVVAVREQNSSCTQYYEGQCISCGQACPTPAIDSIVSPSLACVDNFITLTNHFSGAATEATFSSNGTGTFSITYTTTSPSTFTYKASAADLQKGYIIITATTNDPDGAGPCAATNASRYIKLINTLLPLSVTTNSPVCQNGVLEFEATKAVGNVKWFLADHTIILDGENGSVSNADTNLNGTILALHTASGCASVSTVDNIEILAAPNLNVTVTKNDEPCAGQGNGSIQVAISGGSGSYTICYNNNLSNCVTGAGANFQYVAPGSYTVTVVDNACPNNTFSYPITILPGAVVSTPSVPSSIEACSGQKLTLSGTTGPANSTINWTFPSGNFNALGHTVVRHYATTNMSGTYIAKTINASGCASAGVPVQVTVNETPVISHVQVNCVSGSSVISVTASVSQGTLSYSMDGSTYQSSPLFNGLAGGSYTLHVKGTNTSCEDTVTIHVPNCACPNEPEVTLAHPLTSCGLTSIPLSAAFTNASSATWSTTGGGGFAATSGASPFNTTYTPSASDVLAGQVSLTLTVDDIDGAGPCSEVVRTVLIKLVDTLEQPLITQNQASYCNGDSVTLYSNVSNPVEWFGVGGFNTKEPNVQLDSATQFQSGQYKVVSTGNGCTTKQDSIVLAIAAPPSFTVSTSANNEGCYGQGNGSIEVNVSGGTGNFTICNDYGINCQSGNSYQFKWLASGTYNIYVADASCPNYHLVTPTTIAASIVIPMASNPSYNTPVCKGEDLILTATPSVTGTILWTDPRNNFTESGNTITRSNAQPEMSTTYKVQNMENGCASAPIYLDVHVFDNPVITSIDTLCVGTQDSGRITINATVGYGDSLEYALNDGPYQASPVFDFLSNGMYQIKVRTVGSDCVTIQDELELYCNCYCNKEASISVFPNPSNGTFTVSADLPQASDVISIDVYDLAGRTVYHSDLSGKVGILRHKINIGHYASGTYLLKTTIDGEKFVKTITVAK